MFIGYMLAVLAILGTAKVVVALLVLAVPIIDTFWVIVRRARGRSPFTPDRGHIHHRLLDGGLGHRGTVLLIYAICASLGLMSLVVSTATQVYAFLGALVAFGLLLFLLTRGPDAILEPDAQPQDPPASGSVAAPRAPTRPARGTDLQGGPCLADRCLGGPAIAFTTTRRTKRCGRRPRQPQPQGPAGTEDPRSGRGAHRHEFTPCLPSRKRCRMKTRQPQGRAGRPRPAGAPGDPGSLIGLAAWPALQPRLKSTDPRCAPSNGASAGPDRASGRAEAAGRGASACGATCRPCCSSWWPSP